MKNCKCNNRIDKVIKFLQNEIDEANEKRKSMEGNPFFEGIVKNEDNHVEFCEKILDMLGADSE